MIVINAVESRGRLARLFTSICSVVELMPVSTKAGFGFTAVSCTKRSNTFSRVVADALKPDRPISGPTAVACALTLISPVTLLLNA